MKIKNYTAKLFLFKKGILILPLSLLVGNSIFAQKLIQVSNPVALQRNDELVVLSRGLIQKKLGAIPAGKFITVENAKGREAVQFDDLNNDGKWDEAVFLHSFKPKEKTSFKISITGTQPTTVNTRAHARHRRKDAGDIFGADLQKDSIPAGQSATDFSKQPLPPFLTEGPAWENDKVGFRLYFDVRNGKDIWGKTTPKMVLDTVGVNPKNNYHVQAQWGMDVLKVGSSLGAGSLALFIPQPGKKDTLVRLGGVNMGKVFYERVADGPARSIIRLHYPSWQALKGYKPISVIEEISIWGGQYFYESRVYVKNQPAGSKLVTGIVNLKSKKQNVISSGHDRILFTYDAQSENHDNLGMGIIVQPKYNPAFGQTPNTGTDIQNTYTAKLDIQDTRQSVFRFYAAWEKSAADFTTEAGFRAYLSKQSALFNTPLIIN